MPCKVVYAIKDWDRHYESSETRKLKSLPRVLVPVKHDGKGYRRIIRQANGPTIYGAWILILQLAAKCPVRGVLEDEDGPLTAEDMELKTDCPARIFEEALAFLSRPEVGWVYQKSSGSVNAASRFSGASPDAPGDAGRFPGVTERNGTEGKRIKSLSVPESGQDCSAFEAGSQSSRRKRKGPSIFDKIFEHPERLAIPEAIRSWIEWQATQENPIAENPTPEDVTRILAIAKQSISEAKDPPRMFAAYVGKGTKPKRKYYE